VNAERRRRWHRPVNTGRQRVCSDTCAEVRLAPVVRTVVRAWEDEGAGAAALVVTNAGLLAVLRHPILRPDRE
jgi:hypothetical protein